MSSNLTLGTINRVVSGSNPEQPTIYAPQVMRFVAPGLYPAILGSTPRGRTIRTQVLTFYVVMCVSLFVPFLVYPILSARNGIFLFV